eukprot:scaffold21588_cov85-Cylindrotheca_fusiformis.AAC.1
MEEGWLDANKFDSLYLQKAVESIPGSSFAIVQVSEVRMMVLQQSSVENKAVESNPRSSFAIVQVFEVQMMVLQQSSVENG